MPWAGRLGSEKKDWQIHTSGGHRGCDHMVVGFTTCEISAYPGTPVSSTNKTDCHE
jgi:hypothetical protein